MPFSRARVTFIMLVMPLTASLWPRFVLTEPMSVGWPLLWRKTRDSASTSIGSPTAVPVPCAYNNIIIKGQS